MMYVKGCRGMDGVYELSVREMNDEKQKTSMYSEMSKVRMDRPGSIVSRLNLKAQVGYYLQGMDDVRRFLKISQCRDLCAFLS